MYVGDTCYYTDYVIATFCGIAGVIIVCLVIVIIVMAVRRSKKPADDTIS